ncbi:MAG: glycosyltransferase [Planctomycetota bacterium]|nr:glycosyltransferase [Planctomycetota bacterium]
MTETQSGRLTVAMTGNNYPPEFSGGTERVMQALARELASAGDRLIVICGSEEQHDGRDVVRQEVDGIAVLRLPRLPDEIYRINLERPRLLEVMRATLIEEQVDILHLNHWSHLSDGQVRLAKELGLGVVVTLHDMWTSCPRFFRLPPAGIQCPEGADRTECIRCVNLEYRETPEWVETRLRKRDRDLIAELRSADALVAPSEDCAQACLDYLDWGGQPPDIEVLPHGLLDGKPSPTRGPLGLPLRVGTFGNLNREKGVLLLVEAMAGIAAELHLFGVGHQADFESEIRARSEELGVRMVWHGPYTADDPHPASQMDLAVFPSLCRETYGLVVDEALHHGTPVIVSDAGALPERLAGGGGIAVPAGSVEMLSNAIRGVVEDRDAYHLMRSMVPTEFRTVEAAAERYRHLYSLAWAAARTQS